MVLQRDARNRSNATFSGTATIQGAVIITVRKNRRILSGFADTRVGSAQGGRFNGLLKGLPVGGPYDIEIRIVDRSGAVCDQVMVSDVLVGDVWILAGQSNMQGCGYIKGAPKAVPHVRAFYMNDSWSPAEDPLHNLWQAVDSIHAVLSGGVLPARNPERGAGPGVSFGQRMWQLTGVPQGMLACAHGGTSMSQWDPGLKKMGGHSLYGAMLRRFEKNGARVAGVLWYQGCNDTNAESIPLYTRRMKRLVAAIRRDCGDPDLPFLMAQLARIANWPQEDADRLNSIREQQRLLVQNIPRLAVVPTIDLTLDDEVHVSGRDQIRLGQRFAEAMQVLRLGRKAGLQPIQLKNIKVEVEYELATVVVEFGNVTGELRSADRPSGFTISSSGHVVPAIFDVMLNRNCARIRTTIPFHELNNMALSYGWGGDPYCNISDAANRSLPAFGPVSIGKRRALTDYVRTLEVSNFQPSSARLESLSYPESLDSLTFCKRTFADDFCNLHPEISRHIGNDEAVFYRVEIQCIEPMKLNALLGYDGPLKVWVDGKQLYFDPKGTSPAFPGKAIVPFVGAGQHEVLIALGINKGSAWGIYLRFERRDVPARKLSRPFIAYAMPQIS